jgi:hypothetical protein
LTRGGILLRFLAFAAHLRIGRGRREHSRTLGRTGPLNTLALVILWSGVVDPLVRRWNQRRQRR